VDVTRAHPDRITVLRASLLLFAINKGPFRQQGVVRYFINKVNLAENDTRGTFVRIRITSMPRPGDFDEFDLRRFRVGQLYEVPEQFASLLIIAGYAEPAGSPAIRIEAADSGQIRTPKPKL
jgi:hypothetical protein